MLRSFVRCVDREEPGVVGHYSEVGTPVNVGGRGGLGFEIHFAIRKHFVPLMASLLFERTEQSKCRALIMMSLVDLYSSQVSS